MTKIYLILSGILLVSASAMAAGPVVESGPVQKLSPQSVSIMSVLAANARDFAELATFGNKITEATVQQTSGEFTRFTITIEHCQLRGCLGGAKLFIEQVRDLTPGRFPPFRYNTKIVRLR